MRWERFAYICRKVSAECQQQESISTCLNRVKEEDACDLYGKKNQHNSIASAILDQLAAEKNNEHAAVALNTYRDLNISIHIEEPMRFRRVVAYLSYITFVFFIIVGVYQINVLPTFLNSYKDLNLGTPEYLTWLSKYGFVLVLFISILMIVSLLIGHNIKKLFTFELGIEKHPIIRLLTLKRIQQSYLTIIEIMQFPINSYKQDNTSAPKLLQHLHTVQQSNMCVATEMRELLHIEMRKLTNACEKQMKVISMIIVITVVCSIFFFLSSAYAPIFIIGESL